MTLTRQEIVQKMNFRMSSGGWYANNFNIGLREVLSKALTLPQDTNYASHFAADEIRLYDLRRYFRGYGNADKRGRIEEQYPECLVEVTDEEANARWGQLAGRHAATRWLAEEDRQCADDWFPFTDL
jgi:hypothetical protein